MHALSHVSCDFHSICDSEAINKTRLILPLFFISSALKKTYRDILVLIYSV